MGAARENCHARVCAGGRGHGGVTSGREVRVGQVGGGGWVCARVMGRGWGDEWEHVVRQRASAEGGTAQVMVAGRGCAGAFSGGQCVCVVVVGGGGIQCWGATAQVGGWVGG